MSHNDLKFNQIPFIQVKKLIKEIKVKLGPTKKLSL